MLSPSGWVGTEDQRRTVAKSLASSTPPTPFPQSRRYRPGSWGSPGGEVRAGPLVLGSLVHPTPAYLLLYELEVPPLLRGSVLLSEKQCDHSSQWPSEEERGNRVEAAKSCPHRGLPGSWCVFALLLGRVLSLKEETWLLLFIWKWVYVLQIGSFPSVAQRTAAINF